MAALVGSIQHGTTSIAAGSTSATVTIDAVTLSRALLVFTVRVPNEPNRDTYVTGEITSTTGLTFTRQNSIGNIGGIEWTVIEFADGAATVQRGVVTRDAAADDLTISSITTSRAFPVISIRTSNISGTANALARASFADATTLRLTSSSAPSGNASIVAWQVVEFASDVGAAVQAGTLSAGGAS